MKRCLQCSREYDNSMMFCLDDGAELLYGPAPLDEQATAILLEPPASPGVELSESATQPQIKRADAAEPKGQPSRSSEELRSSGKRAAKPLALAAVAALIVISGFFGYRYFSQATRIQSIAVMPFLNESGNSDLEYLSDGISESLIKSLAGLPELNVKPRSTVIRYKERTAEPGVIARELNVGAILNGRLAQRGEQITLSLELIDAQNDRVIWSERYQRNSTELLTLQSEIAKDVTDKLRIQLSGADRAKLDNQDTSDPEAFRLYLRGRYHASKFTVDGFNQGIAYFNQALARDPAFALAWDGLAYCYYSNWYIPAKTGNANGKAAALKALELDPDLAEAHASLAIGAAWYEYDWVTAEKEFKKAIELKPNYALAHSYYGVALASMGRFDEAVASAKRAVELEPLSAEIGSMLGLVYFYAGQYDRAVEQTKNTIQFEPGFWFAHVFLARSVEKLGDRDRAETVLQHARSIPGANLDPLYSLGRIFALTGRKNEAEAVIKELTENKNAVEMDGYEAAVVYAAVGEKDKAFDQLEKEFATGGWMLNFLRVDPDLEPLRSDPRFADLLKKVNLSH
ncbi:MAG TPA: tetratricopeptide repeat protein [Pyrinomonadaceae bacterium]|nr:tetratricopeptide repeat protein [Pyrinomonadaceae bacterium]